MRRGGRRKKPLPGKKIVLLASLHTPVISRFYMLSVELETG